MSALGTSQALAQQSTDVEQVVVTGTHISGGFSAPTPVTAVTADALAEVSPSNIPDALNKLPEFRNSSSNSTSPTWNSNALTQGNYLNLRNLGTQRSLILVDGLRMPDTQPTGGVDVNTIPQALIQHVDVVTGGASAVYGSQAVVGVVNFVLDKNFNGAKFTAQTGLSAYGDDPSQKFTAVYGTGFDGGKGHIEFSLDHYYIAGIHNINRRPNGDKGYDYVGSATATSPDQVYPDVRFTYADAGGTITTAGALHWYQFNPDGTVHPENLGPGPTTNPNNYCYQCSGGRWYNNWLTSKLRNDQIFVRGSYDLGFATAHAQIFTSEAADVLGIQYDGRLGGTTNITIFNDNPYLNPSVLSVMTANKLTSFSMGKLSEEAPEYMDHAITRSGDFNFGLDGNLGDWHWTADYIYGNAFSASHDNEFNNQRFYAAVDAVRNPANGQIVCGVTLRNPSLLPGCIPLNVMGYGNESPAAINWIMGETYFSVKNTENIAAANISGPLFDLPAGPMSVATGLEYRNQAMKEISNTDPAQASKVDYTGIRGVPANVQISDFTAIGTAKGSESVVEAYGEFNFPLLKDVPLAQYLELSGAGRMTDYSTSGTVYTWKIGVNYNITNDLRMRGTVSRDIAAPTLYNLFAGTQITQGVPADTHTGAQGQLTSISQGNPNLKPERGTMIVGGVVLQPEWLPGFSASVDFYNLRINGSIANLNFANLNLLCDQSGGTAAACANIIRPFPWSDHTAANYPTLVLTTYINQGSQVQSGVDLELGYQFDADSLISGMDGNFNLHAFVSQVLLDKSQLAPGLAYTQNNYYGSSVPLEMFLQQSYQTGAWTFGINERFLANTHKGNSTNRVYNNYAFEPAIWYFGGNINYKLDDAGFMDWLGGKEVGKEIFFNAVNMFNRAPPVVPDCCNAGEQYPTDYHKYDVVGGYYTIGIRLKL
jgi:outer membrane receptor protein involved in Fe transport